MILLLMLLLLTIALADEVDMASLVDHCDDGTTFSRKQAIACLLDAVDRNHDGKIDKTEIEAIPSTYLHWYERVYISVWIGGDPIADIMKPCDVNKDGFITYSDMVSSTATCMPLKGSDGKLTGAMCKLKTYICDRANAILGHNVYK